MPVFAARSQMVDTQETTLLQLQQEERDYQKTVEQAKAEGKPVPWRNWHPDFAAWAPAALFNGMIAPLTHFAIRGVIWYQGESNDAKRAPLYAHLFPTMISDWRRAWDEGDFPFLFVQIANFNTGPEANWPEIRDAQRRTLALRNTGMAVTIDIGDPVDIHPKNKRDVGLRLALAARAISYGETLEWSGPLYRQLTREDHALRVWFDHAKGLTAKEGAVVGFEVAGADGKFVAADAKIEGSSVLGVQFRGIRSGFGPLRLGRESNLQSVQSRRPARIALPGAGVRARPTPERRYAAQCCAEFSGGISI